MRSTFFGFEAAKSGLAAAQAGLDVTGNNIANLSTEGYSRQIVDQSATYFGSPSDKLKPPSLLSRGLGVTIDGISQTRSDFLDLRYRNSSAENGANQKMLSVLGDIEAIFDETQTDGLNAMLEDFYTQLNVLSLNAGEVEYSNLARSGAQKVTKTLNQYAEQLSVVHRQTVEEMQISVDDANTLLHKIDTINRSIQVATLQGSPTNELNDTRNLYLDKLSSYIDIQITHHQDGSLSMHSGDTKLLDAENHTVTTLSVNDSADDIRLMADGAALSPSGGTLFGSMQLLNGRGSFAAAGENAYRGIPYYQSMLDSFTSELSETFNALNGAGKPLFSGSTAASIAVSDEWLADPDWITATTEPDVSKGKNDNILRMISALDQPQNITPGFNGSFSDFLLSTMGEVAVDTDYARDISETSDMVLSTVSNQRESVMGVSLNEETVNLLKYQKAFAASSRVMTALDEALETIINRMGLVGR